MAPQASGRLTPVSFVERVVGHVRRVQQVAEGAARDKRVVIDYGRHEAFLLELLQRTEHERPRVWSDLEDHDSPAWLMDNLQWFAEELHWLLIAGWGSTFGLEARSALVDLGIAMVAQVPSASLVVPGLPPRTGTLVAWLSSKAGALGTLGRRWLDGHVEAQWTRVPTYCSEIGLVREDAGLWRVTQAGEMLLRLHGKDVVQWILTLESALAVGWDDAWRVSAEFIAGLRANRGIGIEATPSDHSDARALEHVERLSSMGLLDAVDVEPSDSVSLRGWQLTELGIVVLDEVAKGAEGPFGILAGAILEDELFVVMESKTKATVQTGERVGATVLHARMVAHEVRNALGPVQHASRALRAALGGATGPTRVLEYLGAIDQGVSRLHRFVTESVRLVPPEPQRLEPFSILDAIAEARKELAPDGVGSLTIETLPVSADPHGQGNRGQFVMAMLNVLRNARQAAGAEVQVTIRVDARTPREILLSIEDDGPGVPDAVREHIFENGVSYREDGTGHGLASLRAVVEDMKGKVRCTTSELGGAKFEIMLPVVEGTP
jgi:signal transduction histidine kinase